MVNVCSKCGKRFDGDSSNIVKNGNKFEVCCWDCMHTDKAGTVDKVEAVEKQLSQSASKGRFEFLEHGGYSTHIDIIVDRYTGVNYLLVKNTNAAGGLSITPLIGEDGKPIVTKD